MMSHNWSMRYTHKFAQAVLFSKQFSHVKACCPQEKLHENHKHGLRGRFGSDPGTFPFEMAILGPDTFCAGRFYF